MEDHTYPGKHYLDEETALEKLFQKDGLFVFCEEGDKIGICVNCNDLFIWGCADAEPLPHSQIGYLLYAVEKTPGGFGFDLWSCTRRCEMPQDPIRKNMEKAGIVLDETVLAPNAYWTHLRNRAK